MARDRALRIARQCSFTALIALAPVLGGCAGSAPDGAAGSSSSSSNASSSGSAGTGGVVGTGGDGTGSGGTGTGGSGGAGTGGTTVTTSGSSSSSSTSSSGSTLDPSVSPGGNFDLSGWQLQLPIGTQGSPQMESGSQLAGPSGFTDIYFYTDETDGAMTFMDPTTGVTTSGSVHPRSELREVTSGWSTAGTNTETVTLAVTEVPHTVAIGQIFQAPPAPSKPLLELQYVKGGTLQVLLESTNQGGNATTHPVGTVTDGAKFTYELSLTGKTITVTIDGAASTFTLPSTFAGESFYFKCGDYDQTATAGTPGTKPGTVVKVYALKVVHQ